MDSYNEIKQLLANKDFKSALLVAFSNSLKLKLTSKINNREKVSATLQSKPILAIATEINLLDGLTTNITEPKLLESNNHLIVFHQKQLEKVHEIWNKNREALITILNVLAGNNFSLNNLEVTSSTETEKTLAKEANKVDNFVDFILEENDDNHHLEVENNTQNWIDDTKELAEKTNEEDAQLEVEVEVEIVEEEIDEDEDMIISEEHQQRAEESWDELMGDLSDDDEEETEEIMVNSVTSEVSPDDEVDDDWNEWLEEDSEDEAQEDSEDEEAIDWSKEDWQEEENLIN